MKMSNRQYTGPMRSGGGRKGGRSGWGWVGAIGRATIKVEENTGVAVGAKVTFENLATEFLMPYRTVKNVVQ
ncbi:MAG: hypothetical protein GDA56_29835 [Hormoscilla sp. GM7CHS1pb]|nr:hypothetical protein [Hormoscilla sp. GM7CHS1pb]